MAEFTRENKKRPDLCRAQSSVSLDRHQPELPQIHTRNDGLYNLRICIVFLLRPRDCIA